MKSKYFQQLFRILIFFLSAISAFSLDIRNGLVRVGTDDLLLKPMMYRLVKIADKSKYEPLFYSEDPRTSFIVVNFDNRTYRLGTSQEFIISQRRISQGIEIEYKSVFSRIVHRITIISIGNERTANGFLSEIIIENLTSRDIKVMTKQVFDTWLGEKSGQHFLLHDGSTPLAEMVFDDENPLSYIISGNDTAAIALLNEGQNKPNSIIIANWKRLSDSKFFYESNLMQGFTMAPYSMNDSAISVFWKERIIAPGSKTVLTTQWVSGSSLKELAEWLNQKFPFSEEDVNNAGVVEAPSVKIQQLNIDDIRALLTKIDNAIERIDVLSNEEIEEILKELELLEQIELSASNTAP